jgi:uncharacterized protein
MDFAAPALRTGVRSIDSLQPGMVLQAVVRNVVAFGAFCDLALKQDGLLHVSE